MSAIVIPQIQLSASELQVFTELAKTSLTQPTKKHTSWVQSLPSSSTIAGTLLAGGALVQYYRDKQKELAALRENVAQDTEALEEAASQKATLEETLVSLRKQLETSKQSLNALREDNQTMTKKITTLEERVRDLTEARQQVQNRLEQQVTKFGVQGKEVENLRNQLRELDTQKTELSQTIEQLRREAVEQRAAAQRALEAKVEALTTATEETQSVREAFDLYKREAADALQREKDRAQREVAEVRLELQTAQKKVLSKGQIVFQQAAAHDLLKRRAEHAERNLATASKAHTQKVRELETSNTELTNTLVEVRRELALKTSELEEQGREYQRQFGVIRKAAAQQAGAQSDLYQKSLRRNTALIDEYNALLDQLKAAESTAAKATQLLSACKKAQTKTTQQLTACEEEKEALRIQANKASELETRVEQLGRLTNQQQARIFDQGRFKAQVEAPLREQIRLLTEKEQQQEAALTLLRTQHETCEQDLHLAKGREVSAKLKLRNWLLFKENMTKYFQVLEGGNVEPKRNVRADLNDLFNRKTKQTDEQIRALFQHAGELVAPKYT